RRLAGAGPPGGGPGPHRARPRAPPGVPAAVRCVPGALPGDAAPVPAAGFTLGRLGPGPEEAVPPKARPGLLTRLYLLRFTLCSPLDARRRASQETGQGRTAPGPGAYFGIAVPGAVRPGGAGTLPEAFAFAAHPCCERGRTLWKSPSSLRDRKST